MKNISLLIILCALFFISCKNDAQQVPSNAHEITPLQPGQIIPGGELKNHRNQPVDLQELTSEGISALFFYRGGWCPYSVTQLHQIANIKDRLTARGVQIIAISPDQPESLERYVSENELGYTLLSDSNMSVSKNFGVAFSVDQEEVDSLKEAGMDIEEHSGYNHNLLPVPSIFITGRDGRIYYQFSNPDHTERISEEALIVAVNEIIELTN